MKRILITGASGFVGQELVRSLLKLDYNIRILARFEQEPASVVVGNDCEIFVVDSSKPDFNLSNLMHNIDVVIHLAARVHVMGDIDPDPLNAFRKVNVEWTKQLAEAAVAAKVKRFIFVSSLHVNGSSSLPHPFQEKDIPNPHSPYAVSKWEAEQSLNSMAKKDDLETVIIRPPIVYGPNVKANFLSLLKLTKTGLPMPVGLLNAKRSLVSVNNLVDFIICCIDHPNASKETFLVSDDNDLSTKELFFKLIKLFGKRPLFLPIPPRLLCVLGTLLGKKDIFERLCAPLQVDIIKAKTLLDWSPVQDIDEGLRETVNWYKKQCTS
jgi:nucleoside-diphosphate-sugar epimerase